MKFGDNKYYEHKLCIDFTKFNLENDNIKNLVILTAGYQGCEQAANFGIKMTMTCTENDELKISVVECREGKFQARNRNCFINDFKGKRIGLKFYMLTAEETEEEEEEDEDVTYYTGTFWIMTEKDNKMIYSHSNWHNYIQPDSIGPYKFEYTKMQNVAVEQSQRIYGFDEREEMPQYLTC